MALNDDKENAIYVPDKASDAIEIPGDDEPKEEEFSDNPYIMSKT